MKKRLVIAVSIYTVVLQVFADDVFIWGGQSQSVGQGTNNQSYGGTDRLLTKQNTYITLVDPTGDNTSSLYPVYTGPAKGSQLPALATAVDVRTAHRLLFVSTGVDGDSITQMQPGTAYYTTQTNRAAIAATNGTLMGLLQEQGETDAFDGMARATYKTWLWAEGDAWFADTGTPIMVSHIITLTNTPQANQNAINGGIDDAVGFHHIIAGPTALTNLVANDGVGVHMLDDVQITLAGKMWATNVINNWYTTSSFVPAPFRR